MADYNLGTAHGTVKIDSDTSGVDKAGQSLDTLSKKGANTKEALNTVGNAMGGAGLAIAGGLGVAIKTAGDFEATLSGIKAVSGATADEMGQLHDKALQIGKDTTFSASEAANAMQELAKAGIPISDILNGAADATVSLAAATGVDMPTAATLASNALNSFGLGAKDLNSAVNEMAQAANASAIDVTDLGMSMGQVSAVAHLAGLSLKDTIVAIGEMGNAGIKGSDAGTSLKTMLMNLQPSTKQAAAEMQKLGIITKDGSNQFYDAQGNVKSLKDIQQVLYDSTKNLTAAQKQQALETIFGSDAVRAAAVMADGGAKSYTDFTKAMEATGSAQDQAKTRMDNMKGSLEQLKGSLETAGISIGEALIPVIKILADYLGKLFDWFNSLPGPVQNVITYVAAATAGFLLFGAGIIKAVSFAQKFTDAVGTIVGALTRKTAADTAAAASSERSAIASAAAWLRSVTDTVRLWAMYAAEAVANAVKAAAAWTINTAKAAAETVAAWVTAAARTIAQWVAMAAAATVNAAKSAAVWVAETAAQTAKLVALWVATSAKIVAQWVVMAAKSVAQAAITAGAWLIANGPAMATALAEFGVAVATTVAGWVTMAASAIADAAVVAAGWLIAMGPVGWAIAIVAALLALIIAFWPQVKGAFEAGAQAVWAAMQQLWQWIVQAWDWIKEKFTEAWQFIVGIFNTIIGAIQDAWNAIINAFKTAAEAVWNALKQAWQWVQDVWNNILGFFRSIPGWIMDVFRAAGSWLLDAGHSILNGLWNGIKTIWNNVIGWFGQVGGWIIGALKGAGSWLLDVGKSIVTGLWNGIKAAGSWLWDQVKSWAMGIFNGIKSLFHIGSPSKLFRDEIGYWLAVGLGEGIKDGTPHATDAAAESARAVIETMQKTLSDGAQLSATIGTNLTPGQVASLGSSPLIGGTASTASAGLNPLTGTGTRNAATFDYAAPNGKTVHIEMNTFNPVAEKASDNEARKLRAAAAVGAF